MRDIKSITILEDGERRHGSYEIADGEICVTSGHGARRVRLGKAEPTALAEQLLREILRERPTRSVEMSGL